jgi:hypothetical protein
MLQHAKKAKPLNMAELAKQFQTKQNQYTNKILITCQHLNSSLNI